MSAFTEESWYRQEIVTDELDEFCDLVAAALGVPRANIGTKGNEKHRRGHHRSQQWILNSAYCTSRTYTVQSGLTADQARHIAGIDIIPGEWGTTENRRKTAEITARVIAAMKAGLLDEVFEVYGAAADLKTVTGYNNRENRAASSDDSHLDHPHLGCDRRKMRDRAFLARLAAIVIGEEDDMFTEESGRRLDALYIGVYGGGPSCGKPVDPENVVNGEPDPKTGQRGAVANAAFTYKNGLFSQLKQIRADIAKLGAGGGVTQEQLDKLADDVADRLGSLQFVADTDS